jgi:hypothetical protein
MMAMLDKSNVKYIPLAKRKSDKTLEEAMDLLKEREEEIKELTGDTDEPEEVQEDEPSEDEEDKPSIPRGGLMGGE